MGRNGRGWLPKLVSDDSYYGPKLLPHTDSGKLLRVRVQSGGDEDLADACPGVQDIENRIRVRD